MARKPARSIRMLSPIDHFTDPFTMVIVDAVLMTPSLRPSRTNSSPKANTAYTWLPYIDPPWAAVHPYRATWSLPGRAVLALPNEHNTGNPVFRLHSHDTSRARFSL